MIERNYAQLQRSNKTSNAGQLHFADVIVDERTCVVLESMSSLSGAAADDGAAVADALVHKITCLSLKYCVVWLILNTSDGQNT